MTKKTDDMDDIRNWAANNMIDYWEDILCPKTKLHAKFSASGSNRWLNCTDSLNLDPGAIENPTNEMAARGTMCHNIAEECIKSNLDATNFLDNVYHIEGFKLTFETEHADMVNAYIEYFKKLIKNGNKEHFYKVELRVDYSEYAPGGFGTLDLAVICIKDKIIHIVDLKTGFIKVYADDNSQLMLYALGIKNSVNIDLSDYTYRLHIYQPSLKRFDYSDVDSNGLEAFGEKVKAIATDITNNKTTRVTGEWCKYCPNNNTCHKLRSETLDLFDEIETVNELKLENANIKDLLKIYNKMNVIQSYLKNISSYLLDQALKGEKIEGYKLVLSNKKNVFKDDAETKLIAMLGSDVIYKKSLITQGEITKLIGKEKMKGLVYKPEGIPELASVDDDRPAINGLTIDDFDVIEEIN